MDFKDVFGFIGILIVFGALLFLAYVTTKYIGNKANKALKGKFINIIETINLGLDKQLHLVKVGEEYLLIASSGKNIEFLSKVDLTGASFEETTENNNMFDFKSLFDKYVQSFKGTLKKESKESKEEIRNPGSESEGEAFKSNLKRLRTLNLRTNYQENNDGDENTNEK